MIAATEALQTILAAAEKRSLVAPTIEERDRIAQAYQLCTAMLEAAVPVARFRCYVTVEKADKKSEVGVSTFTICTTDVAGLKSSLVALTRNATDSYIQLWEQKTDSFDMVSGYQGPTKTRAFRLWMSDLGRFDAPQA